MKKGFIIFVTILVFTNISFAETATKKQARLFEYRDKSKQFMIGFNEKLKAGWHSDFVQNNLEAGRYTVQGFYEGVFDPDSFCEELQHIEDISKETWLIESTGKTIQSHALAGNTEAINVINLLAPQMANVNFESVDVINENNQIDIKKLSPYEVTTINNFAEDWRAFILKEKTLLFSTYRCFRYGKKMPHTFEKLGDFMVNNGEPNWYGKLARLVN